LSLQTRTLRVFDIPKGAADSFEQPDLPESSERRLHLIEEHIHIAQAVSPFPWFKQYCKQLSEIPKAILESLKLVNSAT